MFAIDRRRASLGLLAIAFALLLDGAASAQLLRRRPVVAETADAVVGRPFGVGSITLQLPPEARNGLFNERGFTLTEKNGRALYAAFDARPVRALLREALNRPQSVTVYFLFTGNEPLELELFAPTGVRRVVAPRRDPNAHAQLLRSWWTEFTESTQQANKNDEYPVLVDNYLTSMLSRRLALPSTQETPRMFASPDAEQALGVLLGTESARLRLIEQMLRSDVRTGEAATEPLPAAPARRPLDFPEVAKDVQVEALAQHVPHECLYVRFGSFNNYQWFRGVLDEFGGDLRNLIASRGLNYGINERIQEQLILRENVLAALLGPQVIADVALIGHDPFMREGAGIGMLFQARNNFALRSDINGQRAAALEKHKDASETQVTIADHKVSFISTPDNRLRSFYAIDGDFHLVTTSRNLVRRFFEAGAGDRSLGASREFRFARARMPLDREDSVFAYLSAEFFQELASPRYRVEMNRRLRSTTEIALLKMARWAAKNEGRDTAFATLAEAGLVPEALGLHADGSKLLFVDSGAIVDSLRGSPGSFTPIADVSFDRITQSELRDYRQFEQLYAGQLQQLDPIFVAVKRFAADKNLERIVIDASVSPMAQQHSSMLAKVLGPATKERMGPIQGNLITFEVFSQYQTPAPTHLFFGLRSIPTASPFDSLLPALGVLQNLRIYFGGWPSVGPLSYFGLRDDLPADRNGFARATATLYQRFAGPFITGSTDVDLLADVTGQMRVVEARRPGQLWLSVGDVANSDLRTLANAFGFFRARQITGGNLHFLHTLTSQLGVPADRALQTAEELLEAKLVCALGGELKLQTRPGELPSWSSTAWTQDTGRLLKSAPADFVTPPLDWFRGLELDLWMERNELSLHGEVDMLRRLRPVVEGQEPEPVLPGWPLKGFNLFGGGKQGDVPDAKPDATKPNPNVSNVDENGDKNGGKPSSIKAPPPPVPDNKPAVPEELPLPKSDAPRF